MPKELTQPPRFDWRKHLKVHPAAELFPLMAEAELKELAEDIKTNGLRSPIVMWPNSDKKLLLIDGRNRLDALALLGLLGVDESGCLTLKARSNDHWQFQCAHQVGDPYALALSFNVHRRHLTAEDKRDLIAKLLKVQPEKSNRAIADTIKIADHKTVGSVRAEKEATGEIPQLEKITGKDGKSRPTTVKKRKAATAAKPAQPDDDEADTAALVSAEERKRAYAADDGADVVAHVLRLVEQMTAKQRQQLFLLLDATYSKDRLVTTAPEKPAPTSDNDLEIPGFLQRTAQATQ
jgi:ParB-like nuclease domain